MIPAERGTNEFAKIELPGGGAVASAYAMSRLYSLLVNGGELDGIRLLQPETIARARQQRSLGNDPLSGRLLRFGVGFELNPNPSRLGMAEDWRRWLYTRGVAKPAHQLLLRNARIPDGKCRQSSIRVA
jgi:CubicO group peptidase (beta-lactamase class C family)